MIAYSGRTATRWSPLFLAACPVASKPGAGPFRKGAQCRPMVVEVGAMHALPPPGHARAGGTGEGSAPDHLVQSAKMRIGVGLPSPPVRPVLADEKRLLVLLEEPGGLLGRRLNGSNASRRARRAPGRDVFPRQLRWRSLFAQQAGLRVLRSPRAYVGPVGGAAGGCASSLDLDMLRQVRPWLPAVTAARWVQQPLMKSLSPPNGGSPLGHVTPSLTTPSLDDIRDAGIDWLVNRW